jgi:predicted CXXCH cytochrome family protein
MRGVVLALAMAAGLRGAPEYVDAKVCATCHREIAQSYALTGMGRSFARVTAATVTGSPKDYWHDRSDTHYTVVERGGEWFQRRWQIGFGGAATNVEELRIDYVMGSGNHARSFLHRTARGTLIELPFGWYSEGGGNWAMSPGSDQERPMTRRFVSYKCMSCHNAYPHIPGGIPAGQEAPGSDPIFVGELPQGIDCQRCHGPGGEHARTADRTKIVNPARLDRDRAAEICMGCHLETSSGRIPSSIVRFDRGPFSFVPGERLGNFLMTFDHARGTGHDEKFEAVNSVYRLRQSRCFLKSEGRLTCTTCHNPHRVPRGAEAAAHYSQVCRQCHEVKQTAAHADVRDCAGCHMPKRRAEDTPGMIMTDHLIQRRAGANLTAKFREKAPEEYRGEVVPYYPREVNRLYWAVAQVGLKNNLEAGLPVLAKEVAAHKPKEAEFYVVLGDGLMAAGRKEDAAAAYREAARLAPKSARVVRLVDVKQAIALAPEDPLTWSAAGNYARAIELDPMLPDQHRLLGESRLREGRVAEALAALREALRTDPGDDAAWDLQGRALAEKGESAEAFWDFERALKLRPGSATYLYDYGLALARAGRFEDAERRARAAVAADEKSADAHELLGGLLLRADRLKEAVAEYRRAVELRPDSARLRQRLAEALRRAQ